MSGFNRIPVLGKENTAGARLRGNALPILHQIRHSLALLAETGESSVIDLMSLPLGPGDEKQLLQTLGRGEVTATLDALGPSRIWETALSGVWLVEHLNDEEQRIAFHIEIVTIPHILLSPQEDIEHAIARLDTQLAAEPRASTESPESNRRDNG